MADLFAFAVAEVAPESEPGDLGRYDPDTQQFVWAGTGEVTLGSALCTFGPYGRTSCKSTGTSCNITGVKCDSVFNLCFIRCDYG